MNGALKTLIEVAQHQDATLFLNAQYHNNLPPGIKAQQYFKPHANTLEHAGFDVSSEYNAEQTYDNIWLLTPKNVIEAQYFLAQSCMHLKKGGTLYCAANNKEGASRLIKWLQQLGFENIQTDTRNKARLCWATKSEQHNQDWLNAGKKQYILGDRYLSQPGIFGWNKIDKGSEILTQHLPKNIAGKGADFGCGYGYLSDFLLQHNPEISKLHCADADFRAVNLCKENLSNYTEKTEFTWCDLTKNQSNFKNLNFIVMNPPFHEGKKQDISIGQAFIKNAHTSLKPNGTLWLVANAHLPYESTLKSLFSKIEKINEKQGFKVYQAQK